MFYAPTVVHSNLCSGIEPPTHQSWSSLPRFVQFASSRRPVPFRPLVVIKFCSRKAAQSISAHEKQIHVHVQFTPTIWTLRPTPLTLRSYHSTDSVQHYIPDDRWDTLLRLSLRTGNTRHLKNLSFDSQTDRSFSVGLFKITGLVVHVNFYLMIASPNEDKIMLLWDMSKKKYLPLWGSNSRPSDHMN